jgi:UDP-3-O-[3-hydroxymyristoyl] glucosamine N-acyltransferase LpxD
VLITMKLQDVINPQIGEIVRDSEFKHLGTLQNCSNLMLSWVEDEIYINELMENPGVSAVITKPALVDSLPDYIGVVVSDTPAKSFLLLHNYFAKETDFYGTDSENRIDPSAYIHPKAYIANKNVRVGKRSVIEAGAIIMERCVLCDDVIIRSGAVIGGEGFEFRVVDKEILHVYHAGGVYLHNSVEIQSNTTVSKSIFGGFTTIGEQTKISSLVHIGHGAQIGKRVRIAAQAMIAGVSIGDDAWIGPGALISNSLNIGDGAYITIGSVVTQDISAGTKVSGNFAIPHQKFINFIKSIR